MVIFTTLGLSTQNLMTVNRPAAEELPVQSVGSEELQPVIVAATLSPQVTATMEKSAIAVVTPILVWPVEGHITQTYSDTHLALDIAAPEGAPVYAAAKGIVVAVEWDDGYGNIIRVDHGDGLATRYTKLSDDLVVVGDTVTAGQEIGYVGSTGTSTGPHLHFEVIQDGQAVDPLLWLAESQISGLLLVWPVEGRITQGYSDQHQALDIAAKEGDPVVAVAGGMVVSVGWDDVYGNNVIVDHAGGLQSRYTKLSAYAVEPGELVSQEQVIGSVGSTGTSTGPHLHFELIEHGEKINPLPFLK
jgi:murein DD-endopeptidase MepM/ murein hydrolase activator NlpD